jgi:hypothetical protein
MSNVAPPSLRPVPTTAMAARRLDAIWNAVEKFVSQVELEHLTPVEMERVLRVLDTANACIRVVLSDFGSDPAVHQLIGQSLGIKALIESARERTAALTRISAVVRSGETCRAPVPRCEMTSG